MSQLSNTEGQNNHQQTIIIQESSNGIGTAGFVCALIALVTSCIPFFSWVIWGIGLVLSFIGVFKKPRGFAIAGLIISLIGVILLIIIFAGFGISALTLAGAEAANATVE